MANEAALPTADELMGCDWRGVIANAEPPNCSSFSDAFFAAAKSARTEEQEGDARAFRLLGDVTSLCPRLDTPEDPYVSQVVAQTFRSSALEDFGDEEMALIVDLAPSVDDCELAARLLDLQWVRKRNALAAAEAVSRYVESAKRLAATGDHKGCALRLERGMQLAATLKHKPLMLSAQEAATVILDACATDDTTYLSFDLLRILHKFGFDDAERCAEVAAAAVERARSAGDLHRAQDYLTLRSLWDVRCKKPDATTKANREAAEQWMQAASAAAAQNNFLVAAAHAEKALGCYRKVPGATEERQATHRALLEFQAAAVGHMKRFEVRRDVTHLYEAARELVRGRLPLDALIALASEYQPLAVTAVRARVVENARNHPFSFMVSATAHTSDGRVTGRRGSLLGGTEEEAEGAILAEMRRHLTMHQGFVGQTLVDPARRQIVFEHAIREHEVLRLVSQSPFVPLGSEKLFAKGLWFGLVGDYTSATHILLPQLENALRRLLQESGVVTSSVSSAGVQDERPLNILFELPQLREMMDESIIFDLQTLLVERFGSNLRNRVAHGLVHQDEFYAHVPAYLWWVTLALCVFPMLASDSVDEIVSGAESSESEALNE